MSGLLKLDRTVFLLCDLQEKFRPLIHAFPAVVSNAGKLIRIANETGCKTIVTEQYPKALGNTVSELSSLLRPELSSVHEKKLFSMLTPSVRKEIPSGFAVVLYGIEAHVCVLQTALELREMNIECHIVVDATSSQNTIDRTVALDRLARTNGVYMTTTESVGFQLVRSAEHPFFKAISNIAKEPRIKFE